MNANSKTRWSGSSNMPQELYVYNCISGSSTFWRRVAPARPLSITASPSLLSPHAAAILGANGVERVQEFWSYTRGWYFGTGERLSPDSIRTMELFFAHFRSFRLEPSVFLTHRGNLLLGWEAVDNSAIELEFVPSGYLLYLASTDEEREFSLEEVQELTEFLTVYSVADAEP